MPIFLDFDGVDGSVPSRHPGGVNVVFGDGSVRFVSYSVSGGVVKAGPGTLTLGNANAYNGAARGGVGALVNIGGANTYGGGVSVAIGDLTSDAPVSGIEVASLTLDSGAIDARQPGLELRTRGIFDNGSGGSLLVSLPRTALSEVARRAQCTNNLRQLALSATSHIVGLKLIFSDDGRRAGSVLEIGSVTISRSSTGGFRGVAVESYLLNFAKTRYRK